MDIENLIIVALELCLQIFELHIFKIFPKHMSPPDAMRMKHDPESSAWFHAWLIIVAASSSFDIRLSLLREKPNKKVNHSFVF